ncbi:transglutaminase-like domain-containing protein [Pengzhenrongella frigida]|uniref:Transglutaminase domain-containing protein n=1 Tax=Pengzhenrongella frigida TaxID=1259133 RepID=A0A4Q5N6M2_9MICO|nr:transglutaminase-like domain-containing protein [Cellulomonas sp. HLT2-17]RYV52627.1 transglutaminase domain-containing protein [Cellulomonas sp. HLT2-17]
MTADLRAREPRARELRAAGTPPAVDVVVLVAGLAIALLPLLPVYGVAAVWPPILGGLVAGAAVAVVAAWRRWSALVTAAVAILVYLGAGASLATPGTTVFAVLPTPASITSLLAAVVTVWKQVLTLEPELGASGNLLVAPYLLAFVGVLVSVSIALRAEPRAAGVWAAVVAPVVLGLSVLLGTKQTVQPVAAGVVLVVLLVTWAAMRRGSLVARRLVSLTVMAAVVAASGAVVGPLLAPPARMVLRDDLVPPFDPKDHPSPLSGFREFVKDWKDTDLLTVHGLPEGATVRLATMDAFDGVVWNVAGAEAARGSGEFRRVGEHIATAERGSRARVEIEVHDLPLVWLPTVGYAESFAFDGPDARALADELRYNDATGTAVLTSGVPAGTRWTEEVVVPALPDDDEIGAAPVGSVSLPEPRNVPDAVSLFAGELAGTATSPVLIARSLEAGLAERGWFSHGLTDSGDYPSLSGHGADRLTTLLGGDLMVGDGEQYASAMALMARGMGLPARVVLGFVPDEEQAGAVQITIRGEDVQAWVEINFAGRGWVSFYPTPPDTKTPQDDTPQDQSQPQPQVMQPPPPPADPVMPPTEDTEQPRTEDAEQEARDDDSWRTFVAIGAAATVPVLLVLTPLLLIIAAKRRRRRLRRSTGDGVAQVVGGWDEILDHARDLRRAAPARATRREIAVDLAGAFAAAADDTRRTGAFGRLGISGAVVGLAADADAVVFGRGAPAVAQVDAYWAQVDVLAAAMRTVVPRRHRWRARWSTASLRARRTPRRARRT